MGGIAIGYTVTCKLREIKLGQVACDPVTEHAELWMFLHERCPVTCICFRYEGTSFTYTGTCMLQVETGF